MCAHTEAHPTLQTCTCTHVPGHPDNFTHAHIPSQTHTRRAPRAATAATCTQDTDDVDFLLSMSMSEFGNCIMQLLATVIFIAVVQVRRPR